LRLPALSAKMGKYARTSMKQYQRSLGGRFRMTMNIITRKEDERWLKIHWRL